MNTTVKIVFAIALALNLGVAATVTGVALHQRTLRQARTIQLGTIVVTPANAPKTIQLGTIVVTPSDADWRYAKAHGVRRPAAVQAPAADAAVSENVMEDASLVEALNALSPGQFLDADAAVRMFNALVFDGQGR